MKLMTIHLNSTGSSSRKFKGRAVGCRRIDAPVTAAHIYRTNGRKPAENDDRRTTLVLNTTSGALIPMFITFKLGAERLHHE
jgi:hypothetical protein